MSRSFRERLVWDAASGAILDETRRYMMLRPDAVMGMMKRLPLEARLAALAALEDSILEQGSDSARAYRAMGAGSGADLAHAVAATAPQLGWGIWRFEVGPDRLVLEVRNSPFASGFGPSDHAVCHAITGMLRAVAGLVFDRPATGREIACAAAGHAACRFEAAPKAAGNTTTGE